MNYKPTITFSEKGVKQHYHQTQPTNQTAKKEEYERKIISTLSIILYANHQALAHKMGL